MHLIGGIRPEADDLAPSVGLCRIGSGGARNIERGKRSGDWSDVAVLNRRCIHVASYQVPRAGESDPVAGRSIREAHTAVGIAEEDSAGYLRASLSGCSRNSARGVHLGGERPV